MPPDVDMTIGEIGRLLQEVRDDVKTLKDACPARKLGCNKEYYAQLSEVKEVIQTNKADVDWLKRGFWVITTVGIGALVTAIFTLIKFGINGGG
jgi:hypothetical protein